VDLRERVDDYEAATSEALGVIEAATVGLLDRHAKGEWSARQIIHHLADSEAQSYARLRRLIAEPAGSLIQGYDEAAWASSPVLGYEALPVEHSVEVFRAVRQSSLVILRRLDDVDLERHGVHSESGRYTLNDWLNIYTRHAREHAEQLRAALTS